MKIREEGNKVGGVRVCACISETGGGYDEMIGCYGAKKKKKDIKKNANGLPLSHRADETAAHSTHTSIVR